MKRHYPFLNCSILLLSLPGLISVQPARTSAVDKIQLTVKPKNTDRVYGTSVPDFELEFSGFAGNDDASDIDILPQVQILSFNGNVAEYQLQAYGGVDDNYSFIYEPGTLNVVKKPLVVIPKQTARVYGAPNPIFELTFIGFVPGTNDEFQLDQLPVVTTTATTSTHTGYQTLTPSGGTDNNYKYVYSDGIMEITKAKLIVTANDASKAWSSPNPSFGYLIAGFANGETKDVIDLLPNLSSNATLESNVGKYAITASSASDNDYFFEYVAGQLVVTKADQQITFDAVGDHTFSDGTFLLTASTTFNLPVQFTSVTGNVSVNGGEITPLVPGTTTVRAQQAGNDNVNAAMPVERIFCVNPSKPVINKLGTSALPDLFSSASFGNQWYFDTEVISGATAQKYSPEKSGSYSVKVLNNNCVSQISDAVTLVVMGVNEATTIHLYPNPVINNLFVDGITAGAKLTIFDMSGRKLDLKSKQLNDTHEIDVAHLVTGMYVLQVQSPNGNSKIKFIKK